MKKIGVIVLNFIKYKQTIECVNSLVKDERYKDELCIVIVDNGSKNESLYILQDTYRDNEIVHIIGIDTNLGYAKGNNIGITYLRQKGIEFIFIANSDLIFPSSKVLIDLASKCRINDAVLVPTIKNPNGGLDQRVIYKKKYFYLRMFKELVKSVIRNCFSIASKSNTSYSCREDDSNIYDDYYVISGSGFMLTNYFFDYYRGLFSKTFLYGEECGTIILLHKAGLNSRVINTIPIIHKGAASTPDIIKKMTKERRKIVIDSLVKVLTLLFTPKKLIKNRAK